MLNLVSGQTPIAAARLPGSSEFNSRVSSSSFALQSLSKAVIVESIQIAAKGEPGFPSRGVQIQYKEDA
jgi:hypothetical protein